MLGLVCLSVTKCPRSLPSSSTTSIKESDGSPNNMQPVILVAGDSFYNRLDTDKLGKGKKAVINIATGGSKMEKVQKAISDFAINNPSKRVTKCFINIGTNDIRNCANGIKHLKSPLCSFMKSIKNISSRYQDISAISDTYPFWRLNTSST